MAAIHFLRPDISNAVITLIYWKYDALTPPFISGGIATAHDLIRDLSANLLQRVGRLSSLPWMEYYDRALGLIERFVFWSAFVEQAFLDAGYPELGRWARIGVYLGALVVIFVVAAIIRWFLSIVWAIIAGLFRIVYTVLVWVLHPLRFVLGLFHRLFFGRNGRPFAPGPHAVDHRASRPAQVAGAGVH